MRRIAVAAGCFAALALGGCASIDVYRPSGDQLGRNQSPELPADTQPPYRLGQNVAELAKDMIGVPYSYGGADPSGFDCSGLVYYAYGQTGIRVPRTSEEQFRAARKIALMHATEGDLVFFQDQKKLSHVGIYLGNGLFVHAPESGRAVSLASLEAPYYQQHLVAVGRLLPN
jgi:cell wall-associated NlpC family hydrolase